MDEPLQHAGFSSSSQGDPEILALLKRMQQQMLFLEKKIDVLTNILQSRQFQSAPSEYPERPYPGKSFAKPFPKPFGSRPFDQPYRDKGRHRDRAQGDSRAGRPSDGGGFEAKRFEKRSGEDPRGFEKKRFGKRPGEGKSGFVHSKKSFSGKPKYHGK